MDVIDWLMAGDPAIRWQVMQDLLDADREQVAAERARVAQEGWGAQLLAARGVDGQWSGGAYAPITPPMLPGQPWTATAHVLTELRLLGLDPRSTQARQVVDGVRAVTRWEHDGQPFWAGEVEPCINAALVTNGVYFGVPMDEVVERLLGERMADGGWNCEQERGSVRSSFDTTMAVVEAMAAQERVTSDPRVREARLSGEAYLLERGLLRRRSTGEIVDDSYTRLAFPPRWHYNVLRALEHFRVSGAAPEERMREAIDLVRARRRSDGTWALDVRWGGDAALDHGAVGEPNRWITLGALRVLRWADTLAR